MTDAYDLTALVASMLFAVEKRTKLLRRRLASSISAASHSEYARLTTHIGRMMRSLICAEKNDLSTKPDLSITLTFSVPSEHAEHIAQILCDAGATVSRSACAGAVTTDFDVTLARSNSEALHAFANVIETV